MTSPHHAGFAIGIDLGTSNTVAVLRSPDGRTRPLLFDGQPIMPSVVCLDEAGRLHVGRDAQRMAQLDPARCEPNPKRRIDERTVLLGDREVPVVHLLAAILKAIADKAVETVGFLPRAALTHPAAWGQTRRAALLEAVRLAGWPPVHLVPEPIAAARYFAEVLRRPVPVGASIGVFDFGGGTLDVAVVRNEDPADPRLAGRSSFTVSGSGGDESLGGLDLDDVLVRHVGKLIETSHPQIWRHLAQPQSTADRRYRRLFWEDVRGAKEMLSRSTTAPVPVPGVDHAVHATRDELERLTGPLLDRAVAVALDTISRAGLRADQLAGLFLVGGSSRVPLVARMLHSRLGIAPTVLEQPELPVAEGALAELAPQAESVPTAQFGGMPAPVSAAPASGGPAGGVPGTGVPGAGDPTVTMPSSGGPHGPVGAVPVSPTSPAVGGPGGWQQPAAPYGTAGHPMSGSPPSPPQPWYRRKGVLIPAVAGVAALALVATIVLLVSRDRYVERPFSDLTAVGSVKYPTDSPSGTYVEVVGDHAYLANTDSDGTLTLNAVKLGPKIGKPIWTKEFSSGSATWDEDGVGTTQTDTGITAHPGLIELRYSSTYSGSSEVPGRYIAVDPANGHHWSNVPSGDDDQYTVFPDADIVVHYNSKTGVLEGLDCRNGHRKWHQKAGPVQGEESTAELDRPAMFGYSSAFDDSPSGHQAVTIDSAGIARVIDVSNGKLTGKTRVTPSSANGRHYVFDGMLLDMTFENGYKVSAYPLDDLSTRKWIFNGPSTRFPDWLSPCGESLVCISDFTGDTSTPAEKRAPSRVLTVLGMDEGSKPHWEPIKAPGLQGAVPVGDRILLNSIVDDTAKVTVLDGDGHKDPEKPIADSQAARVDNATVLTANGNVTDLASTWSLTGMGAQSGNLTRIGSAAVELTECEWSDKYLVCPGDGRFDVRSFRD